MRFAKLVFTMLAHFPEGLTFSSVSMRTISSVLSGVLRALLGVLTYLQTPHGNYACKHPINNKDELYISSLSLSTQVLSFFYNKKAKLVSIAKRSTVWFAHG